VIILRISEATNKCGLDGMGVLHAPDFFIFLPFVKNDYGSYFFSELHEQFKRDEYSS
jgi:hypothetical protein